MFNFYKVLVRHLQTHILKVSGRVSERSPNGPPYEVKTYTARVYDMRTADAYNSALQKLSPFYNELKVLLDCHRYSPSNMFNMVLPLAQRSLAEF